MVEKGAVVSKQQLSDESVDGFSACEETPKVEQTKVCSETDVNAVQHLLFCFKEHDAEKDGEQGGSRTHPFLIPLEITFMKLTKEGETFWRTAKVRKDFPQYIAAFFISLRVSGSSISSLPSTRALKRSSK